VSDLREQLEDLAHRGQVRGATDVLAAARRSLPRPAQEASQPSRRAATVVAALTVAALIGSVLVATRSGRQNSAVATDDGIERRGGQSSPLFLLPSRVPHDLAPVGSWGGDAAEAEGATVRNEEWAAIQRWGRFGDDGTPIEVLDVSWSSVIDGGDSLAPYRVGSVRVTVRGHDALLADDNSRLVWQEPGAGVVMVTGTTASAPGSLRAVAEGLRRRPDGGFEVSEPPAGFEPVAEWPGVASEGTKPRSARYAGPDAMLQVQIVDDTELPPGVNLRTSEARKITVRGQPGVISPSLDSPISTGSSAVEPFVGDLNVQWLEPGGERVTVSADGMDESELLTVAEGLERVDGATWRSLNQPVTTTTEPSPPGTPVPTPEVGTESVRVRGTYRGLEHFELFTGPCSFMSHVLESTFEVDGGAAWRFHSDYCGTIDGDMWTGSGTFMFTTEDGATISGETSNSARLPSTGEPYDLHVTAGTGSFAGATGSCSLDNHLRQIRFGLQEQYGTFSCDITRSKTAGDPGGRQVST
jgi:hypothetical protein